MISQEHKCFVGPLLFGEPPSASDIIGEMETQSRSHSQLSLLR